MHENKACPLIPKRCEPDPETGGVIRVGLGPLGKWYPGGSIWPGVLLRWVAVAADQGESCCFRCDYGPTENTWMCEFQKSAT